MKKLYICHTYYHLMITLLKEEETLVTIYLGNAVNNSKRIKEYLVRKKIANNVILETESEYNLSNLENYDDIYLYNDWTNIGEYFRKNKVSYNLIEDGYNYYKYDLYNRHFSLKRKLFNKIFKNNIPFGYSKYAKSIEVNDKSIISKTDKRYTKMIELPRNKLFNNISEKRKYELLELFEVESLEYPEFYKAALVLTQPLFKDGCVNTINSENDQFNYFKDIVQKYTEEGYKVYFKVHPRDKVDYSSLKEVIFMSPDVPIELYFYLGNYIFDVGITHSSTALDYLSNINEKIFLCE